MVHDEAAACSIQSCAELSVSPKATCAGAYAHGEPCARCHAHSIASGPSAPRPTRVGSAVSTIKPHATVLADFLIALFANSIIILIFFSFEASIRYSCQKRFLSVPQAALVHMAPTSGVHACMHPCLWPACSAAAMRIGVSSACHRAMWCPPPIVWGQGLCCWPQNGTCGIGQGLWFGCRMVHGA